MCFASRLRKKEKVLIIAKKEKKKLSEQFTTSKFLMRKFIQVKYDWDKNRDADSPKIKDQVVVIQNEAQNRFSQKKIQFFAEKNLNKFQDNQTWMGLKGLAQPCQKFGDFLFVSLREQSYRFTK
jgi:hypothetical protein